MSDLTINEKEISLFRLKSELVELMQLWDDTEHAENCNVNRIRTNEPASARACNCELVVIENQIKAYVAAEIRKVDNVRSYLRHCDMMAEAAAEEVKRLSALGHTWKSRRERLLDLCRELMLEFGEKRLEGLHGSLALQANGGVQPLDVYNKDLLPEELVSYSVNVPSFVWSQVLMLVANHGSRELERDFEGLHVERLPKGNAIRAALSQDCGLCDGTGLVDGTDFCNLCQGDKRRRIPGARLEPRGQHVRVK